MDTRCNVSHDSLHLLGVRILLLQWSAADKRMNCNISIETNTNDTFRDYCNATSQLPSREKQYLGGISDPGVAAKVLVVVGVDAPVLIILGYMHVSATKCGFGSRNATLRSRECVFLTKHTAFCISEVHFSKLIDALSRKTHTFSFWQFLNENLRSDIRTKVCIV